MTLSKCEALQMSTLCMSGLQLQEFLLQYRVDCARELRDDEDCLMALDMFYEWDGNLNTDSVGGCVYVTWFHFLSHTLLREGIRQG